MLKVFYGNTFSARFEKIKDSLTSRDGLTIQEFFDEPPSQSWITSFVVRENGNNIEQVPELHECRFINLYSGLEGSDFAIDSFGDILTSRSLKISLTAVSTAAYWGCLFGSIGIVANEGMCWSRLLSPDLVRGGSISVPFARPASRNMFFKMAANAATASTPWLAMLSHVRTA